MFKINSVKNYKSFAETLETESGCSVKIEIADKTANHIHYQLNDKHDMSLGVLCVNDGYVSFAPFATFDTAEDEQYIAIHHMVRADELAALLKVFEKLFVS